LYIGYLKKKHFALFLLVVLIMIYVKVDKQYLVAARLFSGL
jgi:hypothetical protein